ncbi:MAG: thiamine-phosphate kinase [Rhodospirillales bacterium]
MADGDGEFDIISALFAPLAGEGALGLTDDAALLRPMPGRDLVLAKDAMVEGVHYLPDMPADMVAGKLLRSNLSDLAAMGARPRGYLLALFRGANTDRAWLEGFAAGLARDQEIFGLSLLGGDSVSSPGGTALSLTIIGDIEPDTALRRNGARPGDIVCVTGTIGDAGLGLAALQGGLAIGEAADRDFLVSRHQMPEPRIAVGEGLRGMASACIDVSDGLLADAGHIAETSSAGLDIDLHRLPRSGAARRLGADPLALATSGDDYELLFTLPAGREGEVRALSARTGVAITEIGRVVAGRRSRLLDAEGSEIVCDKTGWRHY